MILLKTFNNKKFVEIIIHHDEAKQFLVSEGINFGNTLITFRPEVPITVNVSLFNVAMEMPNDILYSYLERILGKVIEIGTRVVQFNSLKGPISKIIRFANRNIRVLHTGQKVDEEKNYNNEQTEKNELETEQNEQQAEINEQQAKKNEQQTQDDQQQPPETDWLAGQIPPPANWDDDQQTNTIEKTQTQTETNKNTEVRITNK